MKQIYTKTGDEGQTSLRDGVRVPKDDLRIETNGQIDQLNAQLGVVRSMLDETQDVAALQLILTVQRELMTVMSHIPTPDGSVNPRELHAQDITAQLGRFCCAGWRLAVVRFHSFGSHARAHGGAPPVVVASGASC